MPAKEIAPGFVAVGRVVAPRGLLGEAKVEPLTDLPERLAPGRSLTVAGERRIIERCRWYRGFVYLKLSGIDGREAAQQLRDHYLQVPEGDLEPLGEGQYYRFQLIGLSVRSTSGLPLGRVAEVLTTGADDVLVVRGMMGEVLVPAVDEIVKEIDLARGSITIEVVPGLLPSRRK